MELEIASRFFSVTGTLAPGADGALSLRDVRISE